MLWALCFVSGGLHAGPGESSARAPKPLLLGGGVEVSKIPVLLDPVLPVGSIRPTAPPLLKEVRCSLTRPVCVGVEEESGTPAEAARQKAALEVLEEAYELSVFGAALGRPRATFADPLVWTPSSSLPLRVERELVSGRGFDAGRAWCRGGPPHAHNALRCVSEATLFALAPAATSHLASGLAVSQQVLSPERDAAAQQSYRHPEVGVLTASREARDFRTDESISVSGFRSLRFFDYLERRSNHGFGEASFLSLALAATRTAPGALRFDSEPDLMEVLLATHRGSRGDVARLFDDFAQWSFRVAEEYRVVPEPSWVIDGSSLPRSLAFPEAIEPTGSVYLRLSLTPEQAAQALAFRMFCEAPVSYVWSVARLSGSGEEINRVPVAYQQTASSAETTVEPFAGTRFLLVAGTNMGGVDLAHPFDPDHGPHEAHGCRISISVLSPGVDARSP